MNSQTRFKVWSLILVNNITFGKLNENIIIQSQTLTEGKEKAIVEMEDMLVRIINGTEESVANE